MPRLTIAFILLVVLHGGCATAAEPEPSSAAPTEAVLSPSARALGQRRVEPRPPAATPDPSIHAGVASERG